MHKIHHLSNEIIYDTVSNILV